MATEKTCDKCGEPATCEVAGEAHILGAVAPGALTSVRHVADACEKCAFELLHEAQNKARRQLVEHLPVHRQLEKIKHERIELEAELKPLAAKIDQWHAGRSEKAPWDKQRKELEAEKTEVLQRLEENERLWKSVQSSVDTVK
jgi:hypothetical protein